MKKVLIDTNIYSASLRGTPDVISVLRQVSHIGITSITIGELLSGFRGGNKEKENREELNTFLDSPRVVFYSIDEDTAEYYSAILNQLRTNGTPIPTNDVWIAAVAFQHGLKLHTLDKHFSKIKGLIIW